MRALSGGLRVIFSSVAMFLVLSAAYTFSISLPASFGASITGDEPFYLLTTQSLLQDRDLDLTQQYQSKSYRAFFDHSEGLWQQSLPREDGVLLSPHNMGLSVLLLPGFAVAGLVGAQVQLLLLAALTFSLTYVLAVRVTGELFWSWLAVGAVALSASALVYATEVYPEIPAALMLVGAVLLLQGKAGFGVWRVSLLVVLLSGMAWLGVKYIPLVGLIALWSLWQMNWRERAMLLTSGGLSAVCFIWFHLQTFGALTPYSISLVYAGDSSLSVFGQHFSATGRVYRLAGLFIDQRFGIGRWSPVLLLAVPSLIFLWYRRGVAVTRLAVALIVAQVLIATFLAVTMMGWWFAGRTLMTVTPLLALPLALFLARANRWGKLAFGILAAQTLAVTIALVSAASAREVTVAVNPFDMTARMFQLPRFIFPNYTYWDFQTWYLTAGWLVFSGVAVVLTLKAQGVRFFSHRSSAGVIPSDQVPVGNADILHLSVNDAPLT